jgi:hypothetical protein
VVNQGATMRLVSLLATVGHQIYRRVALQPRSRAGAARLGGGWCSVVAPQGQAWRGWEQGCPPLRRAALAWQDSPDGSTTTTGMVAAGGQHWMQER